MVDTNCDPRGIDFVIPSNDDASKSISKILEHIGSAVLEGIEERNSSKDKEETTSKTDNAVKEVSSPEVKTKDDEKKETPTPEIETKVVEEKETPKSEVETKVVEEKKSKKAKK